MAGIRGLFIGTGGDSRARLFGDALSRAGLPPAQSISYPEWLNLAEADRRQAMRQVDYIRIESPGRDEQALRAIRALADESTPHVVRPTRDRSGTALLEPPLPKGCIDRPDQLAVGFRRAMRLISEDAASQHGAVFLNHPDEIALACDKPRTLAHLAARGVCIPPPIAELSGSGAGYDAVRNAMAICGRSRVFIKLRGGSSGSGVVAYQHTSTRELAVSTVALEEHPAGTLLRNTRRIRRYHIARDIRQLLDTLCPLGVYVEAWVPKAGVHNRTSDLRVVTIAGKPRHTVLRLSPHPVTNLHLLNQRCDPDVLRQRMRPADWDAVIDTCEKVAASFPRMMYLGIDLAVHADLRKHTVFEVNAFGDLLHGVQEQGENTYESEVAVMASWIRRHA